VPVLVRAGRVALVVAAFGASRRVPVAGRRVLAALRAGFRVVAADRLRGRCPDPEPAADAVPADVARGDAEPARAGAAARDAGRDGDVDHLNSSSISTSSPSISTSSSARTPSGTRSFIVPPGPNGISSLPRLKARASADSQLAASSRLIASLRSTLTSDMDVQPPSAAVNQAAGCQLSGSPPCLAMIGQRTAAGLTRAG
jgi:hypothetical protein